MTLLSLLVAVILAGLIWCLIMMLPLPEPFKKVAQIIMIVFAILWLLHFGGFLPNLRWS